MSDLDAAFQWDPEPWRAALEAAFAWDQTPTTPTRPKRTRGSQTHKAHEATISAQRTDRCRVPGAGCAPRP